MKNKSRRALTEYDKRNHFMEDFYSLFLLQTSMDKPIAISNMIKALQTTMLDTVFVSFCFYFLQK